MNGIEPHIVNEITQLLAIYVPQAGTAAAQTIGSSAALALGSGARKAVKGIWEKLRHKSEQEDSITEDAITAFATNPTELEHQHMLSFILKQLCNKDPNFAQEITQLYDQVQRDPIARNIIHNLSNSQIGVLGDNHGNVYVNLTADYPPQPYALKIKLSFGLTGHLGLDNYVPTLVVEALNIGARTSYVSKVLFENIVDGETRVTNIYDHGKSQALHRFGEPLHSGQAHDYHYHLDDFYIFGTLGQQVIPVAIHVQDQIGNTYREPYTDEMSKSLVQHYNKQHA